MSNKFFEDPILNSPYDYPSLHWELDKEGIPTQQIINSRRDSRLITPIPKPKKRGGKEEQRSLELGVEKPLDDNQQYEVTYQINSIRDFVNQWRNEQSVNWNVTPETAKLLEHWRNYEFQGLKPFFCQIEAVETVIWLSEVAPKIGKKGKNILNKLLLANEEANPGLNRKALKLATGSGKTTVMAMIIAWQVINAIRYPNSKKFCKGFLIITPGITIRDRLKELQPNSLNSIFSKIEIVPNEYKRDLLQAKIVITNYHTFQKKETLNISSGGRKFIEGWRGDSINSIETESQMLHRVLGELDSLKQIFIINDEAHHCYKEKLIDDDEKNKIILKDEEKEEAKSNREAARLWISGIEAISRRFSQSNLSVIDLSATPFFLASSGYAEGTLFPWTVSDFSLMDAIECGIVKLPRVPVADNFSKEMPFYRDLWKNIKNQMPKKGRGKGLKYSPENLPTELMTAIDTLYGHYSLTFDKWETAGIVVPPCFIIVCNNTSTSKLIFDYIAGYEITDERGDKFLKKAACQLFSNFDDFERPLSRPKTILVDSKQLESGEVLDSGFREIAGSEIESFRKEILFREGSGEKVNLSDADLLREVLNTVGKVNKLGSEIRCVVSVAMLTEGWDANNVTHILGVRAFSTQLLCEQVIGRALRRLDYSLNTDSQKFDVEYADILGIPFDFTSQAVQAPVKFPSKVLHVRAISPQRDPLEINFPNVVGYRIQLSDDEVSASFGEDHILELTPKLVGPAVTSNQGIIGEGVELTLQHTKDLRKSSVILHLASHLVKTKYQDADGIPKTHLILKMKRIVREWLEKCLICKGETNIGQLAYRKIADMACERMIAAIVVSAGDSQKRLAIFDPYNYSGSTKTVSFNTSKTLRWETDSRKCHINWAICDSTWEQEFCRILDNYPKVRKWVKNQSLGFEVPYKMGGVARKYIPDFIVVVDDGRDKEDLLNIVCEVKGYRGEDAKEKKNTMDAYWVPGVNNSKKFGRWAFAEFTEVFSMENDFAMQVDQEINKVLNNILVTEINKNV